MTLAEIARALTAYGRPYNVAAHPGLAGSIDLPWVRLPWTADIEAEMVEHGATSEIVRDSGQRHVCVEVDGVRFYAIAPCVVTQARDSEDIDIAPHVDYGGEA